MSRISDRGKRGVREWLRKGLSDELRWLQRGSLSPVAFDILSLPGSNMHGMAWPRKEDQFPVVQGVFIGFSTSMLYNFQGV